MAEEEKQAEDYSYSSSDVTVTITAGMEYPPGTEIGEVLLSSDKKEGKPIPGSKPLEPKGPEEDSKEEIEVNGEAVKKKKRTWEGVYKLNELVGIEEGEKFQVWYYLGVGQGPFLLEAAKIKTDAEKSGTEDITSTGVLADTETTADFTGVFGTISAKASDEGEEKFIPEKVTVKLVPTEFFAQFQEADQASEDYLKGYNIYRFPSEAEAKKAFVDDKEEVQKLKKKYLVNTELIPYYTRDIKDPGKFNKIDDSGGLVNEDGEKWYTDVYIDKNLPPIPSGGRTLYYLVTAVDESGNESEFSEIAVDVGPNAKDVGVFVKKDIEPPSQIKKIDFDLSVPNSIGLYWTDHLDAPKVKNVFATYDRVTRTVSVVWDTTDDPMSDSLFSSLTRNKDFDLLDAGIGKIEEKALFNFGSFNDEQLYQLGSDFTRKTGFNNVAAMKNALVDVVNKTGGIHPAYLLGIMKYVPFYGEEYKFSTEYGYDEETSSSEVKGIMRINTSHPQYRHFLDIIKKGQFTGGVGLEFFDNGVDSKYYLEGKPEQEYVKNPFFSMMIAGLYMWGLKTGSDYSSKHYPNEEITQEEKEFFIKGYAEIMSWESAPQTGESDASNLA